MKKQPEVTDAIKSIIRDKLAWKPLLSVHQMQATLFQHGYRNVNGGFLDWHFVSKTMKKVRIENVERLGSEDRNERLARLKERFRVITDTLVDVIQGQTLLDKNKELVFTTPTERVMAANTLLKWETAMFFAEDVVTKKLDRTIVEKPEPLFLPTRPESKTARWAKQISKILSNDSGVEENI